jgi:hypothetical protein
VIASAQAEKEALALHWQNISNKSARRRVYVASKDGKWLLMICLDAGEHFAKWDEKHFRELEGHIYHSRSVLIRPVLQCLAICLYAAHHRQRHQPASVSKMHIALHAGRTISN